MIGILALIVRGIGSIAGSIVESHELKECKANHIVDEYTYVDNKGCSRLLSNDRKVMYTTAYSSELYGDYILFDLETNEIIKNFSKEKRAIENHNNYVEAEKNNRTTWCPEKNNSHNHDRIKGHRFRDLKNGRTYVVRCIGGITYYIDIVTGNIVRKTDSAEKKVYDKYIITKNERIMKCYQDEKKDFLDNFLWEEHIDWEELHI